MLQVDSGNKNDLMLDRLIEGSRDPGSVVDDRAEVPEWYSFGIHRSPAASPEQMRMLVTESEPLYKCNKTRCKAHENTKHQ